MNESFNERRKDIRIYRNFIFSFYEKGGSSTLHDISQVNNFSKGGMNFSLTYPLKEGTVIVIDLKAPFITEPIHLEGAVLDCREKIAGIIYEIRVKFQDVQSSTLVALEKIENYSKPKGE